MLNATNGARRKNIDWTAVRHCYETTSCGLGWLAKQVGCSKTLVARRLKNIRKNPGVAPNPRTTQWNIATTDFNAACAALDVGLDLLLEYPVDESDNYSNLTV